MSIADKLKKYDTVMYGIIISIVLLILGFLLSYLIRTSGTEIPFSNYLKSLGSRNNPNRMDILIFSLLPNMFLFYFTNFRWQMYEFIKGQVGVSVIFCLIIVFLSL